MIKELIKSIENLLPKAALNITVNIRTSPSLPASIKWVQVRFPKSKKKRIRKKWAKQAKNYVWKEVPKILAVIGRDVYVSPLMYQLLVKHYAKQQANDNTHN